MDELEYFRLAYDIALEIVENIDGYIDALEDIQPQDLLLLRNSIADLIVSIVISDFVTQGNVSKDVAEAIINKRLDIVKEAIVGFLDAEKNTSEKNIDFVDFIKPCNN